MARVTIASGSAMSAEAGARAADHGGNAVDAAIAAAIVSMCTDPGIIAPGASGYVTIWPPEGDPVVIDGYAEMPGRGLPPERFGAGTREVHLQYGGGMHTIVGHGSVATPGAFAAFGLASDRYGAVPWPTVMEPAIDAAEHGFPLSGAAAEYLVYSHEAVFGWNPDSHAALHHADGSHLAAGETVRIEHLADSLRLLAAEGAASLYRGDLASRIVAEMEAHGGLITAADLAAYEAVVREPIQFRIDDWTVATNPPPAVGGAALAALLLLLAEHDFTGWNEADVDYFARAQHAVFQYRRDRLDRVTERTGLIDEMIALATVGDLDALRSPSTIHTSAVDTSGLACSITVSAGYGSGLMIPETGLWMNNSLGEIELNANGLHSWEPGTRLLSNMAPTVARRDDGSVIAIGSPGADRITSAIAAVLVNFTHLGMSLRQAIAHPRMHVEIFDGRHMIAHEPGVPTHAVEELEPRRFPDLSMYFGGVQAAVWDPIAGLFAAADPRRAGGTARGGDG